MIMYVFGKGGGIGVDFSVHIHESTKIQVLQIKSLLQSKHDKIII